MPSPAMRLFKKAKWSQFVLPHSLDFNNKIPGYKAGQTISKWETAVI